MQIDLRDREAPDWHSMFRMHLDGEDVSERCFYADDEQGLAGLYLTNGDGRFYQDLTTGEPALEWRQGRVELVPPGRHAAVAYAAFLLDRAVTEFGLCDPLQVPKYYRDLHEALQLPRDAPARD